MKRKISVFIVLLVSCLFAESQEMQGLAGAYTNKNYLLDQPFGIDSQWIYPSRAYLTTAPASHFIQGVGVNFNPNAENVDLVAQMLATHGFKRMRIELDWGDLDYQTESNISSQPTAIAALQAAQKWGLRPLIVLNANQGNPCPHLSMIHTVTANAAQGASSVQLDGTSDLVVGYSGISNLNTYTMNQVIVTGISGNTVTLSQPLPVALTAGQVIGMNTFKYIPFTVPDDPHYNAAQQAATMAGWEKYVLAISNIVTQCLGTKPGASDMGFDLELWNELTFGSQYLILPLYYGQPMLADSLSVGNALMTNTAAVLTENAGQFGGVVLEDGFANENPFAASSLEPPRFGALGKHPYPVSATYPAGQERVEGMLNALLDVDDYSFIPSYSTYMPEYYGTGLQTETIIRDLTSITTSVYGAAHGQHARVVNGRVLPCTVFITEIGIIPAAVGVMDSPTSLLMKAKGESRILTFFLNKGAGLVDLFAACGGGDWDYQVLSLTFEQYAVTNSTYPADDTPYVSPALHIISEIVSQMANGVDNSLTESKTRKLEVKEILGSNNNYQFAGDGTAAHPPGYDREAFAFLPYQVNTHKFVIPYYVMTRNIAQPLTPETFEIKFTGVHAKGASISVYDPLNDVSVPVVVNSATGNELTLTVTAADYPYLLIINEAP
ncbi:MAG: hypothetical protein JO077_11675 [Verrucomicrobia bacterium]|nr:hypothetical protein [Verrucomicrobiota bacterium]